MKKEMAIAVLIGFLLGLIITYGIYRLRISHVKKMPTPTPTNQPNTSSTEDESILAIHNPENGTVQKEKSTTVTGAALPNSYIVLFVNDTDYLRKTDQQGNFTFEVPLQTGSNVLSLQLLQDDGKTVTKERTIIVTTVYDTGTPTDMGSDTTATKSAKPAIKK